MGRQFAVIVAAGSGSRFGAKMPKQFCMLEGKPVLRHTIEALHHAMPHANIIIVLSRDMVDLWQELCASQQLESPTIVIGGDTRFRSVANALAYMSENFGSLDSNDLVAIHDGARPLLTDSVVNAALHALSNPHICGAIPAIAMTDSLRRLTSDTGESQAVDRTLYRAVQTPQIFRGKQLIDAYHRALLVKNEALFTDDASVMEYAGFTNLVLTHGDSINIKITHPVDLAIASILLDDKHIK